MAVVMTVEGVRMVVASAEDLIVMKILAGRPKDIEDVVAILGAKGGYARRSTHPRDTEARRKCPRTRKKFLAPVASPGAVAALPNVTE